MTGQVKLTGIVLTTMPIGDYDRRITILTKERGNITAFAKGARKPTSAFLACSQPFTFGEFILYEGRSSYNLVSADIRTYFEELRNDLSSIYYGMYFCEFTNYMTKENMECSAFLNLLYLSLKTLSNDKIPNELVRDIFELKFLTINGEMPQVFECVSCGKKEELMWFSQERNGALCQDCRKRYDAFAVSPSALYTLQFIAATPLKKLYSFTVTPEVLSELSYIVQTYTKRHVAHDMKSLEMLDIF